MSQRQSPFDPFAIDDDKDNDRGTAAHLTAASNYNSTGTHAARTSKNTKPLPPRLNVILSLHEEVSSTAVVDPEGDGGSLSQLSIEGKLTARVESSNANKNSPFSLQIAGPMVSTATMICNDHCVLQGDLEDTFGDDIGNVKCKVDIPKSKLAGCEILRYSIRTQTQNMPILVHAKIALESDICRIIVQIRSNLSNQGNISNFTIIVAIPITIRGETVKVTRGERGVWDANARIVTWKIGNLPHGESCLVGAEAEVSAEVANMLNENPLALEMAKSKIVCPVLVRCSSEVDQVSDMALTAMELPGNPATIVQNDMRSYQLLHRVAKAGTG